MVERKEINSAFTSEESYLCHITWYNFKYYLITFITTFHKIKMEGDLKEG